MDLSFRIAKNDLIREATHQIEAVPFIALLLKSSGPTCSLSRCLPIRAGLSTGFKSVATAGRFSDPEGVWRNPVFGAGCIPQRSDEACPVRRRQRLRGG